jgi:hypothetical protein
MKDFLELIQEYYRGFSETTIFEDEELSPEEIFPSLKFKPANISPLLKPIVHELDRLIAADPLLPNGKKLTYFIFINKDELPFLQISLLRPIKITVNQNGFEGFGKRITAARYLYERPAANQDVRPVKYYYEPEGLHSQLLVQLALDIATSLSSLGYLDKNLYSKKAQDTIGIE